MKIGDQLLHVKNMHKKYVNFNANNVTILHKQHKKINIWESFDRKTPVLQKDLHELEDFIDPKF